MRIVAPLVMLAPALLIAGCSSSSSGASGPVSLPPVSSDTPSASVQPTDSNAPTPSNSDSPSTAPTSDSPSASTSPSASPSPTKPATFGCATSVLKVTLGASQGAAGHQITPVVFTNTSTSSCTMTGFPGVSFVTGDSSTQVGAPAVKDGATGAAVPIAPGDSASALISAADPDNYPAATCMPVAVKGYRVYPPNQTAAAFVALPDGTMACSATGVNQLRVKSVEIGSNG